MRYTPRAMGVRARPRPEQPLVLGEFTISSVLGTGGSGTVYAACSERHGEVALKVLHAHLALSERERRRFLDEIERMRRVRSLSLVPLVSAGVLPDGRPFLGMPRLRGESLAERLKRGPLPPVAALARFGEIAEGAAALHAAGLVHRDIKPENVFLDDPSGRAVLLDFGIARDLAAPTSTTTRAGGVRGSPAYMAPERFFGAPASIASDVYELGVVLYIMLVGRLPWDAENDAAERLHPKRPADRGVDLPGALVAVLMGALSTRPEARPRGAWALAEDALRALDADAARPTETADVALHRAPSSPSTECSSEEPTPGAVVGGRYRLDQRLGRGGMAEVWAATHTVIHSQVALKFLIASFAGDPQHRRRFLREARAAAAVRHPHVVQIHDVIDRGEDTPVLVMELLEGESLGQRLGREHALTLEQTAAILLPVISALEAAHARGVVHRDLKPDNIFLARAGEGPERVVVLDFGIAKLAESASLSTSAVHTADGAMLGTPFYMSPEQIYGETDIDRRSDVWSLGVIFYECLTGCRPTQGANLGQVLKVIANDEIVPIERRRPELPPALASLVMRMLSRDRVDRPPSMTAVHRELMKLRTVRARSRRPLATVATIAAGVGVVVAVGTHRWGTAARPGQPVQVVPAQSAPVETSLPSEPLLAPLPAPVLVEAPAESAPVPRVRTQTRDRAHDARPSVAAATVAERLDSGVWNRPPF